MGSSKRLSPLFSWRGAIVDSDLNSTQRHVGLTLSLHMSERGDSCYPSMETLVGETGLGLSTVRAALAAMEKTGWLVREISHGRGKSNRYTATIPKPPGASGNKTAGSEQENRPETLVKPPAAGGEDVNLEGDSESGADKPPDTALAVLSEDVVEASESEGQRLVAFFVDEARSRGIDPPGRVKGQLARYAKDLLSEGRSAREVALGIRRMLDRRIVQPAMLANFVVEAALPQSRESRPDRLAPEEMIRRAQETRRREIDDAEE